MKEVAAREEELRLAMIAANAPAEEKEEEAAVIDIEKKPEISYEDFAKLQFRVGEIIACEEVKKSKKLLCSQVKIGYYIETLSAISCILCSASRVSPLTREYDKYPFILSIFVKFLLPHFGQTSMLNS